MARTEEKRDVEKRDVEKREGGSLLGRGFGLVKGVRRFVRGALLSFLERDEESETPARKWRRTEREETPTDYERQGPPTPVVEPHGAARDERSFEQRRRGGPVTGEAPPKAHGPRHTGGGKRRGRADADEEAEVEAIESQADLPIVDYDQLSTGEIVEVVRALDLDELRRVRDYEIANKHRRAIVDAIDRRLAA